MNTNRTDDKEKVQPEEQATNEVDSRSTGENRRGDE